MLVCCLGDSVLDVVVSVDDGLQRDDDVPARVLLAPGGQAANVAAWVRAAGERARMLGPRSADTTGALVDRELTTRGIELAGPRYPGRPGAVVSVVSRGRRSMASDAGALGWPPEVFDTADLRGADWLVVSGYVLYRVPDPGPLTALIERAHGNGVAVALDLSSAHLLTGFGAREAAGWVDRVRPVTVFANDDEWGVVGRLLPADVDVVHKQGPRGATFRVGGCVERRTTVPHRVVDPTGAGDALAAGYVVGGPDLAMTLAARCLGQAGAQPPLGPGTGPESRWP